MDTEKDDKIFISHVFDKARESLNKNIPCATHFLDLRKQSIIQGIKKDFGSDFILWGGYGDAERKLLIFLPDYEIDVSVFLSVIRAEHNGAKPLSHRDYLGALMNLGIKREFIGDILVFENMADIIINPSSADFIFSNLTRAANSNLKISSLPISDLRIPTPDAKKITFSVSSMRVDSVLSSAFNLSRSKAAEAVKAQLVYVNDALCLKPDKNISYGDKITLRKKGRVIISDISSIKSRKGNTFVNALIFK